MAAATPHLAFQDLDARTQRRLIMHAVVRITFGGVGLLLLYVLLPDARRSGARAVVELLVGLCVFSGLLVWQIRQIVSATYPGLRALEALALAGPVLVFVFSFVYLSLSRANPNQFSEPLDHVRALYFTVTVISTVGFGDIVPRTDAARLFVTAQMALDLVLIVGIARSIVFAAKLGARRREDERAR